MNEKASLLGQRVVWYRRMQRLTVRELGERSGIAPNTISRLERGELQDLRSAHVLRIAEALELTPNDLIMSEVALLLR